MKHLSFLICISIVTIFTAGAQVNYTFSAVSGAYTAISGGNTAALVEAQAISGFSDTDEGYANSLPIGFNFNYNGTAYSTISANTDGFAAFTNFAPIDNDTTQGYYADDLEMGALGPTVIRPILAPLWDDMETSSTTNIKYITTGTTPNRIFTLEWNNLLWDYDADAPVISFQIKLYETTNLIEFVYRQENGDFSSASGSDGASIGITAIGTGSNNFIALNNSSTSPTASATVNTTDIIDKPATGQIYRFTPLSVTPVTLSSFDGVKKDNINLITWVTLTELNTKGFELQRSSDGINFEDIGFISTNASGGNSSSQINYLFEDTRPLTHNNYYRLKQINKDGNITYSQIIQVKGLEVIKLLVRKIYPNPVKDLLSLLVDAPANNKINLKVIDISGKTIIQQNIEVVTGTNNIPVNVAKLPAGKYILKVFYGSGGESVTSKFVKR